MAGQVAIGKAPKQPEPVRPSILSNDDQERGERKRNRIGRTESWLMTSLEGMEDAMEQ